MAGGSIDWPSRRLAMRQGRCQSAPVGIGSI
jgi:hypothetical protein